MLGDIKDLVKCYKCLYYHDKDGNYKKEIRETQEKDHEGKNKWICNTCYDYDTRSKEELRIGASFDKSQAIILKDLSYRVRMLELENQGQQAKIERLEDEIKQDRQANKKGKK